MHISDVFVTMNIAIVSLETLQENLSIGSTQTALHKCTDVSQYSHTYLTLLVVVSTLAANAGKSALRLIYTHRL